MCAILIFPNWYNLVFFLKYFLNIIIHNHIINQNKREYQIVPIRVKKKMNHSLYFGVHLKINIES